MRRRFVAHMGLLAVVVSAGIFASGCPGGAQPVFFLDKTLETAIRLELGRPLGFLTQADLLNLERLDLRGLNIQYIGELQYATNMTWLDLDTNNVADITALGYLTNLETLVLDSNEVFDIDPLRNLLGLRALSLFDNQIADIAALVTAAEVPGGWAERPGVNVVLDSRHLSDQAINVDIPRLQTLGVNVVLAVPEGD